MRCPTGVCRLDVDGSWARTTIDSNGDTMQDPRAGLRWTEGKINRSGMDGNHILSFTGLKAKEFKSRGTFPSPEGPRMGRLRDYLFFSSALGTLKHGVKYTLSRLL